MVKKKSRDPKTNHTQRLKKVIVGLLLFFLIILLAPLTEIKHNDGKNNVVPTQPIPSTSISRQPDQPETIILKELSDGTRISLTTDMTKDAEKERQLYIIPQGKTKNAVHLRDFSICTTPEVSTSSEEFQEAILNAGGCGDGQEYYLISLTDPYTIQRISLPYSFINSIGSQPVRFVAKNILLFKKMATIKKGNEYVGTIEYYTADLNQPGIYQKSDQR